MFEKEKKNLQRWVLQSGGGNLEMGFFFLSFLLSSFLSFIIYLILPFFLSSFLSFFLSFCIYYLCLSRFFFFLLLHQAFSVLKSP
jgi:hypothetical protein